MTMTIVEPARLVTGGVDTHLDLHIAAALDELGAHPITAAIARYVPYSSSTRPMRGEGEESPSATTVPRRITNRVQRLGCSECSSSKTYKVPKEPGASWATVVKASTTRASR
jgi:hypothetical protein